MNEEVKLIDKDVEVKLIDKGISVNEDYVSGTVHVEITKHYNTDSITFKPRVIDWWRRTDHNYEGLGKNFIVVDEAIEIYEIKDRHKWIDEQKIMKVEKSMENLISRYLKEKV